MGVDAWMYSSFLELNLPALSSWGILEGENKFVDGAWEIILFCASVESPGDTEPTLWLPGVSIPFL